MPATLISFSFWERVKEGFGKVGTWWRILEKESDESKRVREAHQFMAEVKTNIMKTGVVVNKTKGYDSQENPREMVPEHQAEVIAWKMAKSKGLPAGKRPKRQ
jgi:hypothetical protein